MNATTTFYRVGNIHKENQGMWYKPNGEYSGDIHTKYSFCKSCTLLMPFDAECVGYLSATKTLEELYAWFSKEEISQLKADGFGIIQYEAEDYKFHNGHWLINQDSSNQVEILN